MEEVFTHETRLLRRAFWLIKCRWIAVMGTALTVTMAHFLFSISLQVRPLYVVIGFLAFENMICFGLLNRARSKDADPSLTFLERMVQVQISTDLILLTVLLHFRAASKIPSSSISSFISPSRGSSRGPGCVTSRRPWPSAYWC